MRKKNQRLAELQLQAQQSRLTVKADVFQDKKTRVRKEGAASDERYGDISLVRVEDSVSQASFGDEQFAKPPALTEYNDGALVDKGAEAPKLSLFSVEPTGVGGLQHAGSDSTTLRTIASL